jgi:hypothetical protein
MTLGAHRADRRTVRARDDRLADRRRACERNAPRVLWFGSWKNSMSSYAPAWVKTNQTQSLMTYLLTHRDSLRPELLARWDSAGAAERRVLVLPNGVLAALGANPALLLFITCYRICLLLDVRPNEIPGRRDYEVNNTIKPDQQQKGRIASVRNEDSVLADETVITPFCRRSDVIVFPIPYRCPP